MNNSRQLDLKKYTGIRKNEIDKDRATPHRPVFHTSKTARNESSIKNKHNGFAKQSNKTIMN